VDGKRNDRLRYVRSLTVTTFSYTDSLAGWCEDARWCDSE